MAELEPAMHEPQRYPTYQPTGVEWMPEIPVGWEMRKVGHSFRTIGSGTTPNTDKSIYYQDAEIDWINTGDLNDGYLLETKKKVSKVALEELSALKVYPSGSLIVAMYGATIGKLAITAIEGCANQACAVLADSPIFDIRYAFYWFLASKQHILTLASGGGQPNINQELIRSLRMPCPTAEEQRAIARFLDEKTDQLDQLLTQKRQLLALLAEERAALINHAVTQGLDAAAPRRESGVAWLGEVPAHWEVKRLKHLTTKIGSGVTPKGGAEVYQKEGIPILRSQNIHFDGLRLDDVAFIDEEVHQSMNNSQVLPGDVLLNITGASIGRCYFADETLGEANVNQHVCIVRSNASISTEFLWAVLSTELGQEQIQQAQNGSGREGLNFENLKKFIICLPPLPEQQEIMDFVAEHSARIAETTATINQEIALLHEYRAALIAEAVTGQLDVRAYAPAAVLM